MIQKTSNMEDSVLNHYPAEIFNFIMSRGYNKQIYLRYLKMGLDDLIELKDNVKDENNKITILKNRSYFIGERRYGIVLNNSKYIETSRDQSLDNSKFIENHEASEASENLLLKNFKIEVKSYKKRYQNLKNTSFKKAIREIRKLNGSKIKGFLYLNANLVVEKIKNGNIDAIAFAELAFTELEKILKKERNPIKDVCSGADAGYNRLLIEIQDRLNIRLSDYFKREEKILENYHKERNILKEECRNKRKKIEDEEYKKREKKENKLKKKEDFNEDD